MKTTILLTALFLMCGQASALTVLTTDTVIVSGEIFDSIGVINNATITMTGGTVTDDFIMYDTSNLVISGGSIGLLGQGYRTTCNLEISETANISNLGIHQSTNATISGGIFGKTDISTSGNVNFYGGNITDYLVAYTEVNIHGYGFNYNPLAGAYDGGQLTGYWLDGGIFSIDLKNYGGGDLPIESTYDNLNLVPEPTTLALIGIGGLLLRRRK